MPEEIKLKCAHCWHTMEILHPRGGAQQTEKCCWCDARQTVPYRAPKEPHGPFIYRDHPDVGPRPEADTINDTGA